ncbi:MAG: sugar nucleotide-binding protein, partial [Rhodomicrobiaceae bacterium]
HQLSRLCREENARYIHISTDCVFSGSRGDYIESDFADTNDLYGRSKFLGEVHQPHSVTIRTSTIGHELTTKYGLLEWFLSQKSQCKGFKHAHFSGLPTVELARVIRDHVSSNKDLTGLYHVGATSISKYDLLKLIANIYNKDIDIIEEQKFIIDRSLNSSRFTKKTGYIAPTWPELIQAMYDQHITEGL